MSTKEGDHNRATVADADRLSAAGTDSLSELRLAVFEGADGSAFRDARLCEHRALPSSARDPAFSARSIAPMVVGNGPSLRPKPESRRGRSPRNRPEISARRCASKT